MRDLTRVASLMFDSKITQKTNLKIWSSNKNKQHAPHGDNLKTLSLAMFLATNLSLECS